jgi:tetratricopeptide (TPR) repeat protein
MYCKKVALLKVVGLLILVTSLSAQNKKYTVEEANAFLQAQDFKNAAVALESVVKQDSKNGRAWFQLGVSSYNLKKYEESLKAYAKADSLQFAQPTARYNIACVHALMNNRDAALDALANAVAAGFSQVQTLETDTDLADLREDPRFKNILEQADRNARPCEYSDKHREFDFWIGEWDVFNSQGQQIGTNVIQKFINGCVIYENWTSARSGYYGKSFNYYDPAAGKWKQNWVDAMGGIVWYEGDVKDGAMHFTGASIGIDGVKQLAQVTLTPLPDGRIHHVINQSTDDGKTWSVYFDGMYVKKSAEGNVKN